MAVKLDEYLIENEIFERDRFLLSAMGEFIFAVDSLLEYKRELFKESPL